MKMKMSLAVSALLLGSGAFAAMEFTPAETLSNASAGITNDGHAFKTKLVRLGDGTLITAFGEGVGPDVYDLKKDGVRKARDIFVRSCKPSDAPTNKQCSLESAWSPAVNVSNHANLSTINTRWTELPEGGIDPEAAPTPFYGDAGKPNIFNAGKFATVSWVSKYCPAMEGDADGISDQRMISYNERGGITLPFSCVWVSHINFAAANPTWKAQQLTTGIRDAMQDVNKGQSVVNKDGWTVGPWAVTWQEDPHGLQIGGADGPGDGASGANVTHGTDIWYAKTFHIDRGFTDAPVRITNNFTSIGQGGNTSPVFLHDGTLIEELERGNTAASRANMMMVADDVNDVDPQVMIAYEETKGADRLDNGKFVRYHTFQYNRAPGSYGQYENGEPGDIISDPAENSRRVRFVTQKKPGANGMRMGIFWRQGSATEGGPGDIMVRLGFKDSVDADSTGFRPADMVPAVDPNAAAIDYAASTLINNTPASNLSSNTIPWAPVDVNDLLDANDLPEDNKLTDTTDLNAFEDARAHRAQIRGNDFYIGYTYTRDWAVAAYTDMDNYNFYFRRYSSVDSNWTKASNLSQIKRAEKLHVKEPRLVGMPGSTPKCTAPTPVLEECQDKDAVLIAWGTETNVYAHVGGSDEGDIVYTISKDKGDSYAEPLVVVPGFVEGQMNRFESQLRSSPAGNIVYAVWNENRNDINASFSQLSVSDDRPVAP